MLKTLKTAEVCKNPEKSSLKSETYKGIVFEILDMLFGLSLVKINEK